LKKFLTKEKCYMDKKESLYFKDWYEKAARDLRRVSKRLEEGDMEEAGFHLQQAIEKYFKGYLLRKGWKLKKVHDLEFLLDEAIKYKKELEEFRPLCQEVTGYYFTERYPYIQKEPSHQEINTNLEKAKALIKIIKKS